MWVSELELHHFRNHSHTTLALPAGVSIFVGSNGQGKTNLIEAIGYLAYQSSHRVAQDRTLVQEGQDTAVVRARVNHADRHAEVAAEISLRGANRAKLAGNTVSMGELSGWVKAVLFTPEDLSLIRGEPAGRRRYLDSTMAVLRPATAAILGDYERVVKQRNALLKTHRGRPTPDLESTLRSWDDAFVDLAGAYTTARVQLLRQLSPAVTAAYATVAPGNDVSLGLESTAMTDEGLLAEDLEGHYRSELDRQRGAEWERGMTLVGPHRDDLALVLNGLPSRTHSSQGEAWSLALGLRMAQAVLYREESTSGDPIMILDDVFAELDRSRRATLEALVADYEQVLVTAAVWEDVPQAFSGQVFDVANGEVAPRGQ